MKKLLLIFAASFVFSAAVFCEEGLNLDIGTGASISVVGKPYADFDSNLNYEFSNRIALGLGIKENFNFTPGKKITNGSNGESLLYIQPYLLFKAGYFTMAGGLTVSNDTDPGYNNAYVRLGTDIPVWEAGPGKIGFDAGLEGWLSLNCIESKSEKAGDSFAAGIGTIFTTMLNTVKLNAGVKYYLPL